MFFSNSSLLLVVVTVLRAAVMAKITMDNLELVFGLTDYAMKLTVAYCDTSKFKHTERWQICGRWQKSGLKKID